MIKINWKKLGEKLYKNPLFKILKSWITILSTGETSIDKNNPNLTRIDVEKEIREIDEEVIDLQDQISKEEDEENKKTLLKRINERKEDFFKKKYKLGLNRQKNARKKFWRIITIIYLLFFFIEAILSFFSFHVTDKIEMNIGLTLFITQIFYTLASLRQVGETDKGALSFLSNFILNLGSGLTFVPLGFCRIRTIPKYIIVQELPDEAEKIFETSLKEDKKSVPPGMSAPMHIVCGFPKGEGVKGDHLHTRLTGRATPVVTYRVIDPISFFQYVGSLKEARRRMTDVAAAMLGTEIAKTTYSEVVENMAKYNALLQTAIVRKIDGYSEPNSKSWGIHFEDAWLKPFLFGHSLHKAMSELVEAGFKKDATIINAEASSEAITLKGVAEASVVQNRENALTESFSKRAIDLKVTGPEIFYGDIADRIAKNNTILAGNDAIASIGGMVKTLQIFGEKKQIKDIVPEENEKKINETEDATNEGGSK